MNFCQWNIFLNCAHKSVKSFLNILKYFFLSFLAMFVLVFIGAIKNGVFHLFHNSVRLESKKFDFFRCLYLAQAAHDFDGKCKMNDVWIYWMELKETFLSEANWNQVENRIFLHNFDWRCKKIASMVVSGVR